MKKTMTFAVMHFSVAFTVAYLLTGSVVVGGAVALVEPAINTVAFYFHEMVWKKVEKKEGVVKEQSDDSSQQLSSRFSNNEITFAS
ncbi:DUF2061 domain-containing protein [Alteromonas sp. 07-89-2]|mgnify:FL=1|jgi:uncharacterized membrane protein|uniref:DUF2061 domain-containing protein n=1 Tax=unclassified Alteromonas TaxID=2614992 RepID=UPI00148DEEA3|nr:MULTISPECIES: DUF2061 domain-containing protein [unclassified Alteromonas]MDK2765106.1 DUF2061 domain-containing protein [Alteromonas macleodii]MEC7530109.1 DUF2061 domain-containing protein [Pseudomonadota bacterium]MCG7638212.1 DUF2061 domain-containing protein [Alteromonas sp. CNT1-28]MCG7815151.1 DUF2061 domain-containing protein [Alteromonas sp. MCA-1]NOH58934.1 DUF2061 domain-containing protein [Alteromonas sp. 07-89-2]